MMGEQDIALIDAFINGKLSEQERIQFEERRKSDPEFNKEVELLLSISEGYERMELKEQMQELEEGFKAKVDTYGMPDKVSASEMPVRKRPPLRWMAIAAGIAALISMPFIIQQFNDSPDIKDGKMKYGIPQDTILPQDSIEGVDGEILPKHLQNKIWKQGDYNNDSIKGIEGDVTPSNIKNKDIMQKLNKLKSKRRKAYDNYISYKFYSGHKGDSIKLKVLKENYEKLNDQLISFELKYSKYIDEPDSLIIF